MTDIVARLLALWFVVCALPALAEPALPADIAAPRSVAAPQPPGGSTTPAAAPAATALPAPTAALPSGSRAEARLQAWRAELDEIAAALASGDLVDVALAEMRARAMRIRGEAETTAVDAAPRLRAVRSRLARLAPPAGPVADSESDAVKRERALHAASLASLGGIAQQAEIVRLMAEEIVADINGRGRARFAARLLERGRSVADPALWATLAAEVGAAAPRFFGIVEAWRVWLGDAERRIAVAWVVGVALAILLLFLWRRRLLALVMRRADEGPVPRLRKATLAAAVVLIDAAVPIAILLALRLVVSSFGIAPPRVAAAIAAANLSGANLLLPPLADLALSGFVLPASFLLLARGLDRALLARRRPAWRLVPIGDAAAASLSAWLLRASAIYAAGLGLVVASRMLIMPALVIEAVQAAAALLVALVGACVLRILAAADVPPERTGAGDRRWGWLIPVGWIAVVATAAAALGGYLRLAAFLAGLTVWTAIVLGLVYLALILIDEATTEWFRPEARFGRFLARNLGSSARDVDQLGVLVSGILRVGLLAFAFVLVLVPMGIAPSDVWSALSGALAKLSFGGAAPSLSTVLGALALFTAGILITRGLQSWLESRFLPRTDFDMGVKASIHTGAGYVGILVAATVAFAYAGLDMQNVAIVAGALSVGIGFGLQSIVNNFVSGLILLAERPVKIGDWVVVGKTEGIVRRINVRSTEIETFDGLSVIVPNSTLISDVVENWMHTAKPVRVAVAARTGFDADPPTVQAILVACAGEQPAVLPDPPPYALLTAFGEIGLEFKLYVFLSAGEPVPRVSSGLRVAIARRFREAGLEMPSYGGPPSDWPGPPRAAVATGHRAAGGHRPGTVP